MCILNQAFACKFILTAVIEYVNNLMKLRYMKPAQPHFVISMSDCLAMGAHFYSAVCYSDTLRGLTVEHFAGKLVTNTEHTTTPLFLFKLLDVHLESWTKRGEKGLDSEQ